MALVSCFVIGVFGSRSSISQPVDWPVTQYNRSSTNGSLFRCRRLRQQMLLCSAQDEIGQVAESVVHSRDKSLSKLPRLAVFDMDSTLIQHETIDELASFVGKKEEVEEITRQAMNGELDFKHALAARVEVLKGIVAQDAFQHIIDNLVFTPGAKELLYVLRKSGCRTVLASGGFDFLANYVRDELQMDEAHSNILEVDMFGKLTGRLYPGSQIIDSTAKKNILLTSAERFEIPLNSTLAVGDGSNDLEMIGAAGTGIAFMAKPVVQAKSKHKINEKNLLCVLDILGFGDHSEIERILKGL